MTANSKRLFLNLLLLAVVVALVWFVLTSDQEQKSLPEALYDQSMGKDVTHVVIHIAGSEDIQIENLGEEGNRVWKITQPIKHDADKSKLQILFTLLTDPVSSSYDVKGMELEKYGLDKEDVSISFNGVKLVLGDLNQVSQTRYVLKGDKIYLITENIYGLLQMGVDSFIKDNEKMTEKDSDQL